MIGNIIITIVIHTLNSNSLIIKNIVVTAVVAMFNSVEKIDTILSCTIPSALFMISYMSLPSYCFNDSFDAFFKITLSKNKCNSIFHFDK